MKTQIQQHATKAVNGDSQAACSVPSPLVGEGRREAAG